jgi:hypothetical protein
MLPQIFKIRWPDNDYRPGYSFVECAHSCKKDSLCAARAQTAIPKHRIRGGVNGSNPPYGQRELEEKLTDYQHHHLGSIISTIHVHLTPHLCLEVMLLKGKTKAIKAIADGLIAAKGVRQGKLVLTTTRKEK